MALQSNGRPRIKVLVVDDSALIRTLLREIVDQQPDMTVVGAAQDPIMARQMIRELSPDVLTLDVEMPKMSGLEFLEKLMRLRPMPVIMVSSLTQTGSDTALRALELGAFDVIGKPKVDVKAGVEASATELVEKIRAAASARLRDVYATSSKPPSLLPGAAIRRAAERVIVIGASTGGTEAIKTLVARLPAQMPAIVIAQHMPAGFTTSFARRLGQLCELQVKEAEDGDVLSPGFVYIAPGGLHLRLSRASGALVLALSDDALVNRHRPSVDVLFRSAAHVAGSAAIGVILTGMGDDGARGMLDLKQAGAYNLAQDQASSVVFGMPREAIEAGGVDEVLPLEDIAPRLVRLLQSGPVAVRR